MATLEDFNVQWGALSRPTIERIVAEGKSVLEATAPVHIQCTEFEAEDLLKLVSSKAKRTNRNGDLPYWHRLERLLREAISDYRAGKVLRGAWRP